MGFGSHILILKIAIARALAEMNQMLMMHLNLKIKRRVANTQYLLHLQWAQTATCAQKPPILRLQIV